MNRESEDNQDKLVLDLGCGDEKQQADAVGIDVSADAKAADHIVDIEKEGIPFDAGTVDAIYARMFAEHVDTADLLIECYRVLKPGGKLYLTVPHPFTTGFWQDWTHTIQPGFTVDGIQYLSESHDMHYEHELGSWEVIDVNIQIWLNLESLPGRILSAGFSALFSQFNASTREELLKLPFTGGWLEATLAKS